MNVINYKREINCSVDEAVERVSNALRNEGFGVLTRIDFHLKVKEKLNREMLPTVILGACKPSLAFDAIQENSDVASLLPCNVVVRDLGNGKTSIEVAKPTAMMEILGDPELVKLSRDADLQLKRALEAM